MVKAFLRLKKIEKLGSPLDSSHPAKKNKHTRGEQSIAGKEVKSPTVRYPWNQCNDWVVNFTHHQNTF